MHCYNLLLSQASVDVDNPLVLPITLTSTDHCIVLKPTNASANMLIKLETSYDGGQTWVEVSPHPAADSSILVFESTIYAPLGEKVRIVLYTQTTATMDELWITKRS